MSLSQHATFSGSMRAGMRARAAICSEIYAKILRLDPSSIPRVTEGELGNLLVNDTQRILDSYSYFHFCWIGFIEIIVISGLLFIDLGVFALFGVAVLALLVPAQIFFSIKVSHARSRVTIQSDVRVQKMSEILSGIRTVKLSAWEPYFMDVVATLRGNEVRHLRVAAVLRALNAALFLAAPVLVSFATFTAYTLIGKNTLTPAVVFSSIAFFSVLSRVLTFMPLGWLATSEAGVACRRLDRFFNLRELSSIPHDERMDVQHISPTDLGGFEDYSDCDNGSEEESVTDGGHGFSRVALRGVQLSYTPKQSMSDDPNFTAVLTDVSMDVKDGELVSVIGPVGSGKSTLLLGILGEVLCTRGSFQKHGSIAYCAQQPWIVNGTVRENITMFGGSDSQFCSEWYDAVIDKCCLKPDLQIFAAGDMSEIGERGINLSGGQKARIALARAVYSRADIYLLDDPLSAVDSAVSARLLRGVFGPEGLLCDKAQIIVTHQLHILPLSTRIVVLNGGTIEHNGTFEELRNHGVEFSGFSGVEDDLDRERSFAALERDCGEEIDDSETEGEELNRILKDVNIHLARQSKAEKNVREVDEAALEQKKIGDEAEDAYENMSDAVDHAISNEGQLVAEEDRRVGRVTRDVYKAYVKAGGGYLSLFGVLLLFTLAQVVRQVAEVWLGRWSTASDSLDDPSDEADLFQENRTNALIFLGLTLGTVFFTLLRAAFFADRTMAASQGLHDQLLKRVLHATPSFFDSNPIGRILNRFSKDIDQMDVMLPITAQDFLQIAFVALGALATIAWILPWFLIPLVPIVAGFIHLQRMYKKSSRELKRIDGISRSPIYAHFVETATGLATVRAYSAEANFTQHFHNQIDLNHAAYHMFACAGRWLGVRLDALAGMVVFFTSLTVLLMAQNVLDPGLAGVALTQSILMTGVFQCMFT